MLILNIDVSFDIPSESTQKTFKIRRSSEKREFSTTSERAQNSTAFRYSRLAGTILAAFSAKTE
jgi:hypothetical protein